MSRRRTVYVEASTATRVMEQSRLRLLCVSLFFFLCFLSISVKLGEMMILAQTTPETRTADENSTLTPEDEEVVAGNPRITRGDVTDRNGVVIATSLMTQSAFANPREISNLQEAASRLAKALKIDEKQLLSRMKGHRSFVWIKRGLTPVEQQAVNNLGIPGVYFQPEEKRIYPYGKLFSHALGYVGVDNKGLAGIEKQFDMQLDDEDLNHEAVALSLDVRLQHILRDELQSAVQQFQATGGAGVIADVNTGEVLALVSLPDFDPYRPAKATDSQKFNRATLGAYEMGSTFKTFTLALALDSGTTTYKGGYDATRPLKLANAVISDSHPKSRWLSVPEIYAYSSNIGTARMILDVGIKRQRDFMEKLGMLDPVSIELPERAVPQYPKDWRELSGVTIAFGHGLSVSPLHLVRGVANLVNGGLLTPLTLMKNGNEGKAEPERIISEKTSELVAQMMRLVVTHGTGSKADVPGYRVGGKTGTAEKSTAGGYSKHSNLSSFVAVFPADRPRYVALMMVDEPKGSSTTGGWVAAPATARVVNRMGPLLGLAPDYTPQADPSARYWVSTERRSPQVAERRKPAPQVIHAAAY